jgi:NTE family protein
MTDATHHPAAGHRPPGSVRAVVPADPRPVTLALQGGGSIGAFTWGVLDRLLDEPAIRVGAVSGASAGAMNAAMLAQGIAAGGPAEAKRLLERFWRRVAVAAGSPDVPWARWLAPFGGAVATPVADALRQAASGLSRPSQPAGPQPAPRRP